MSLIILQPHLFCRPVKGVWMTRAEQRASDKCS